MSESAVQTKGAEAATNAEATRGGLVLAPPVDIFESEASITLLADMPGVSPENLEIDLNEGVLTITGNSASGEANNEEEVFREYRPATYQRKFTLSQSVDQAKIEARLSDGVLRLELPKAEKARPRKIQIKS